ncbi:MAG: carboxypeptidase M32, partial [Thaumarchaeota archaeon]|nr:carboxypeptidase M32 [Nitrososphaerota archaeon]
MAKNPVVKDILKRYTQVWALNHSLAVMGWDLETHMPVGGARSRGLASGQLAMLVQKANLDLKGLAEKADKQKDLDDVEKGMVRSIKRGLHYYTRVPPELVDEIQRVISEATVVWRTARKKSEFKLFKPHLAKIIGLNRKVAEKLGYKGHPYNALLDLYEEDFRVKEADAVFSRLVPGTKKIVAKVRGQGVFPAKHPLESVKYEMKAMEGVNEGVLKMLEMPMDKFRMDVSTHPFTIGIAPDDVRITTRYEGSDFRASMFGTIHECGHALYGLGIGDDLAYTPAEGGASLGFHESQSRFWENVVGRSREFSKLALPMLKKNLKFLGRYDAESLYYYFNMVRTSFIRVDADELTYNLHIALRYEIEKKMLAGDVEAGELPELWNDTFENYFGARPPTDAQGVLQDVHWSGGSMGYFPTYTLGNVIAGMIWHKMGDGEVTRSAVAKGDLMKLRGWLKSNIHKWGSVYPPKALQE